MVRYGLANESKTIGDRIKSADLIGWDSQGRFVSVEVKTSTGIIHPSQLVWRDLVRRDGGIGIIATRIEDLIT